MIAGNIKYMKYCKEDISLIENYEKAIADKENMWDCHHRDEVRVLPSGLVVLRTMEELIENGRYYDCPANELIFMKREDHLALHGKYNFLGKHHKNRNTENLRKPKSTTENMKKAKVGYKPSKKCIEAAIKSTKNKPRSEFGRKYVEHYGYSCTKNKKQYQREQMYYIINGFCRWEKDKSPLEGFFE